MYQTKKNRSRRKNIDFYLVIACLKIPLTRDPEFDHSWTCISTLQSLTGKYREIQGNPCNENRDPAMKTGVPCNEYRFFPVGIDLQGFPVSFTGFGFAV